MDDLISRQAAIDAMEQAKKQYFDRRVIIGKMQDIVSNLPSAQPEIVRCKDCIYFDRYVDCIEKNQWDGFCADWARNTYEDWYCSRAERRIDG